MNVLLRQKNVHHRHKKFPLFSSMLLIFKDLKSCLRFSVSVIARLGGCVAITLKWNIVILNEVKNLIESMPYKTEILRLKPQNDIVTQSLDQAKELDLEPAPYLIRGSSRIMTTIGTEFTMNIKQNSHAIYKLFTKLTIVIILTEN